MFVRVVTVATTLLVAWPALAEPLGVDAARRFVVGKTFAYSCFDGTRGAGRIQSDLSVAGTIQIRGNGPIRFVQLPPGTIKVKGELVCASVRGIPMEPCFVVDRTAAESFRGSVSGLPFRLLRFHPPRPAHAVGGAHDASDLAAAVDPGGGAAVRRLQQRSIAHVIRSARRPFRAPLLFVPGTADAGRASRCPSAPGRGR